MPRDIDHIIERLKAELPGVEVTQLKVKHPADDDGLWFIKIPGRSGNVQIESSDGSCPFPSNLILPTTGSMDGALTRLSKKSGGFTPARFSDVNFSKVSTKPQKEHSYSSFVLIANGTGMPFAD